MPLLLASRDLTPFLTWLGVMILLLVVVGVGLMVFRARVLAKSGHDLEVTGGLLRDLRAMRDRGEISIEEYERARRAMAARAAARADARAAARGDDPILDAASAALSGGVIGEKKKLASEEEVAAKRAQVRGSQEGELRARPGFDLTGRPLPKPGANPESKPPPRDPKAGRPRTGDDHGG